ncbi:DUF6174 domain-containing protein [Deinococcus sp.]|uniref:DUF6174 domain-containing protein n=1 Tax=Deinococcus sp. TaxID=47478 RepID=UPI003B5CAF77
MKRVFALLTLIPLLGACSVAETAPETVTATCANAAQSVKAQQLELNRARLKWLEAKLKDYSYDYHRVALVGYDIKITVKAGQYQGFEPLFPDDAFTLDQASFYRGTVDGVFAEIQEALSADRSTDCSGIELIYDATYGYPTLFRIEDTTPDVADDSGWITLENLKPL